MKLEVRVTVKLYYASGRRVLPECSSTILLSTFSPMGCRVEAPPLSYLSIIIIIMLPFHNILTLSFYYYHILSLSIYKHIITSTVIMLQYYFNGKFSFFSPSFKSMRNMMENKNIIASRKTVSLVCSLKIHLLTYFYISVFLDF